MSNNNTSKLPSKFSSRNKMGSNTQITLEELAKHKTEKDAWMAINGKVYNVTDYIAKHPGGKSTIMEGVGKDATAIFKQAHSYINPDNFLPGKQVGVLKKKLTPLSDAVKFHQEYELALESREKFVGAEGKE